MNEWKTEINAKSQGRKDAKTRLLSLRLCALATLRSILFPFFLRSAHGAVLTDYAKLLRATGRSSEAAVLEARGGAAVTATD